MRNCFPSVMLCQEGEREGMRVREGEREKERRIQYKRAFIILYRTVVPIYRIHFTTTTMTPASELANNTILKFMAPVHRSPPVYLQHDICGPGM